MTILFTEKELEWIEKELFNWHVKDGCPEEIKKSINRKLELIYHNKSNTLLEG